ncbi:MAG: hypothetical protein ACTHU0_35430 [Kofleriaceae bacterium]
MKIQDVQNDSMSPGTAVQLKGVVVTAIDSFGARTGDFWVQDPAGGAFSGIKVFGAPLDQVAQLAPGDIVDITNAEKDEFALTSDTSGRTVTEIKGAGGGQMVVTKKGTGTVPAPAMVDALVLGRMTKAERDAEWEKWEGVRIMVTNARQLTAIRSFNSTSPAPDTYEFRITGDARVQSALADLPEDAVATDCYASITGVGDYFFNWLVLPTATADSVGDGTTCAAEESGTTECRDGIDNDGDGFTDCMDFSCQGTDPMCSTSATISDVQMGNVTGPVELNDVYVTARSFNNKNFWIASSLTAAPNEGVYVFRGNGNTVPALDATIVPGAKVNVVGKAEEFNNDTNGGTLTEITGATVTLVEPAAAAPTPVTTQTAAALLDPSTGAAHESVLVQLQNVKVLSVGTATFWVGQLQQGTSTFLSDDDIYRLEAADVGKCFTMTGIWTYQVYDNAYGLLPISKVEEGTCN